MSLEAVRLGDAVREDGGVLQTGPFGSQLKQAEYADEGVPVIMPKDIRNGEVVTQTVARVSEATAHRLARHRIAINGIVLPRRGEVTKRAFIGEQQAGWLCGSGCIKIETKGLLVWPKYLYYFLGAPGSIEWLERNAVGSTMLNLSAEIVSRFPIRLPTIDIQKETAAILSTYDDLIENNRRRIALLEEAARMLYREWFVHLHFPGHEHVKITNGLPAEWKQRTLGDVVEVVKDTIKPSQFMDDDIHIGLEHIPRRSFTLADWESAEELASSKTRFEKSDILFCKIRPYFHKVGFTLRAGLASSDALAWRVKDTEDWPLVVCATSSDHFVAMASKTVREGSKMPRADWKVLQKYSIPKPPSGLLGIFNDTVGPITAQCKALALQNRALVQARDLLLPRLMNGEVAV